MAAVHSGRRPAGDPQDAYRPQKRPRLCHVVACKCRDGRPSVIEEVLGSALTGSQLNPEVLNFLIAFLPATSLSRFTVYLTYQRQHQQKFIPFSNNENSTSQPNFCNFYPILPLRRCIDHHGSSHSTCQHDNAAIPRIRRTESDSCCRRHCQHRPFCNTRTRVVY